jgi:hypothetical protein
MPYAARCTATSTEDSNAKQLVTVATRRATLHTAAQGTGEWVPINSPEKSPIFNLNPNTQTLVPRPVPQARGAPTSVSMVAGATGGVTTNRLRAM